VTPRMRPSRAAASRNAWAFLRLVAFVCGPAALGATRTSSSPETASSTQQSTELSSTNSPAAAEPGTPGAAAVQPAPAQAPGSAPAQPTTRREVPDYRQLEPEPTTAGDVLIWVPRVILLPAYLVTEYMLRVPVGATAGRLRDRSAIAAQLSWRWPVFAYLDGVAAVGFSNVFDAQLTNFRWDLLRLSAELGVRTAAAFGKSNFRMVFGMGSEPFRDGLRLTSFRFALGVTYAL
jgi:hypothetical protein